MINRSLFAMLLSRVGWSWAAVACLPFSLWAAEPNTVAWPQFRGPTGQGVAEAHTPTQFGLQQGLTWQTPIPGKGWSSPVVSNGRIWLTTAIETPATEAQRAERLANVQLANTKEVAGSVELRALCVDFETGKVIHNLLLITHDSPQPIHSLNSYASPTPILENDRVYCHFGAHGTWCLDANTGEVIWTRTLIIDHSVGPGGSPAIVGDHLLLVCDGIDVQYVAALNKHTGEEVWRTSRPPMRATNGEFQKAYSTPLIINVNGITQAVIPGAQWIVSYDPQTGEEFWRADHGNGFSISSTPIYTGSDDRTGLVVFTTGYGQSEIVAVRPDGRGDVTSTHVAWRVDRNVPEKPSPVHVGGLLYFVDDNGVFSCFQAEDATPLFRKRVPGNYSASILFAGGHLYLSNQEGTVTVVKQSQAFEPVAEIALDARLMASPAVVGNDLLFRSENSLMRFSSPK